jgi:Bacterial Ig domain/Putative Ig domain
MPRRTWVFCGLFLIAAASLLAQTQTSVTTCGTVDAFVAASANTTGLITIGGHAFAIAAGTTLQNQSLVTSGANVCLTAALNASGQVTDPARITANVTSHVALCATVSSYTAATAVTDGSLAIGGRTFPIAAGTTISNSDLIQIGADLCLHATLNGAGEIIVPSSVTLHADSKVTICGTVNAYTAATTNAPGSITIDGHGFRIAAGTTIGGSAAIQVGVSICLDATVDINGDIIPPSSVRPNHPPQLTVPGPQSVAAGSTLHVNVSASDQDSGDTVHIAASDVPQHASFASHDGNPADGMLAFTPSDDQAGQTFTVRFTATDNAGAADAKSVSIQVTPRGGGNHPPQLHVPGPQSVAPGATLRFSVDASDSDAGDSVSIRASDVPRNATFAPMDGNPARGDVVFTPDGSQAGQQFTISFTATDAHDASAAATVTVHVTRGQGEGNRPPVLSVPGPQFIAPDHTLTFRVAASDPDGDAVTLGAGPLPPHSTFEPPTGTFTFTPSSDQVGQTFPVTFTARDPKGAETSRNVDVHVVTSSEEFGPPIISVPPSPRFVTPDVPDRFIVTATPQKPQCGVTLAARGLPAGASFDAATGEFTFTASPSQVGQRFRVTFSAADCDNRVSVAIVDIIVRTNAPPPGPDTVPSLCVPVTEIVFTGSCAAVKLPIVNDGDGELTLQSVAMADGSRFRAGGAPSGPIVMPPHSSIEIEVSFDGDNSTPVSDRIVIRSGAGGGGTTEVFVRNGPPRRRASSH